MSGLKGLNFSRIVRQMNLKQKSLSGRQVKVVSPGGFPYEAYNGKAQVTPWSIIRMIEFSRDVAYSKTSPDDKIFLDMDKLCQDHILFMAYTSCQISPKFYDTSLCKSPLEIRVELVSVGKTSYRAKNSIFVEGLAEPVIENFIQPVLISPATRKPSPLPDWWVEKYTQGLEDKGSINPPRHVVPESGVLHRYQTKITASDLDCLWHVNWSNYLKFNFNAFIDFAHSKHGPKTIHQAFRNTKQFSLVFLKEAKVNDTLDIHLWKDPENTNLFKFQCLKDSDVICESQIELYPRDSDRSISPGLLEGEASVSS